jgi:hypothetical protein
MANANPFDEDENEPLAKRMRERVPDLAALREIGISEVG